MKKYLVEDTKSGVTEHFASKDKALKFYFALLESMFPADVIFWECKQINRPRKAKEEIQSWTNVPT